MEADWARSVGQRCDRAGSGRAISSGGGAAAARTHGRCYRV
jgi:hypothetical protein